eukprot:TRINITY_DN4501_c0_g1_i1.p1 TRINITY_DN4501_c0_g1~~TRINITY_DN4501_c0_g1_i1.p1  ORF type:complete len:490 (-),score=111.20 TRINITY_DN4501_c0_g1_i1:112-1581(-)
MEKSTDTQKEQTNKIQFSFSTEFEVLSQAATRFLVMGSLRAPHYQEAERAPLDLVTVIDRSGSMSDKMDLVKQTLQFMIKQLTKIDSLSIVIYDDVIQTVLPLSPMDQGGKTKASLAVQKIFPRGGTNLCGGLIEGLDHLRNKTASSNTLNRVSSLLLFTDGLANVGITDVPSIIRLMKEKKSTDPVQSDILPKPTETEQTQTNEKPVESTEIKVDEDLPCTVYTFGFGADHDATMLKSIADAGNGLYYHVKDPDAIADCFADCLGGLLSVVGQNIFLDFKCVGESRIIKINTKFPITVVEPSVHFRVKLPDLQSEEERDLLLEVSVPESSPASQVPVVHGSMSYFNVITVQQESLEIQCFVDRGAENSQSNYYVDRQRNRILAADAMLTSKEAADLGNLEVARNAINTAKDTITNSISSKDPFCLSLLDDLNEVFVGLKDRETFHTVGSKRMTTYHHTHSYQRSNKSTLSYNTAVRTQISHNFKDVNK